MIKYKGYILLIEDDLGAAKAMADYLIMKGFDVKTFPNAETGLQELSSETILVITDLRLQGQDGLDVVRRVKAYDPDLPVIVITAYGTIQNAVEAIKLGAVNYLTKPIEPFLLLKQVLDIEEKRGLQNRIAHLEEVLHKEQGFDDMIGRSKPMERVYSLIKQVAPSNATVLITGESGTGKELVANSIHKRSNRANKPFVIINCGAIPSNLVESELFGHEKGAFTGADRKSPGKFLLADGGTLFIDEIGDLEKDLQPKLLRAIEYQRFYPVGSEKEVQVDVRIIAATNTDLGRAVEEKRFREDLYYRLRVIEISVPPLRLRREDIPLLISHFWGRLALINHRDPPPISREVLEGLLSYPWPGNVRELKNTLESMFLLSPQEGTRIDQLPLYITQIPIQRLAIPYEGGMTMEEIEKKAIEQALEQNAGNRTKAAKQLGISVRTLQRKLRLLRG